jgi:TctA family transporter
MVLLIGGFLLLGLQPGPEFLQEHMDMAYGLAFVLIIANFTGALALILLAKHLAKITVIPGHLLTPILVSLVVVGAYATENHFEDVLFVFIFGILGVAMKVYGYSRPALLLGFVLAPLLENYLFISLNTYGPMFFTRPISLGITVLIIIGGLLPLFRYLRRRKQEALEDEKGAA